MFLVEIFLLNFFLIYDTPTLGHLSSSMKAWAMSDTWNLYDFYSQRSPMPWSSCQLKGGLLAPNFYLPPFYPHFATVLSPSYPHFKGASGNWFANIQNLISMYSVISLKYESLHTWKTSRPSPGCSRCRGHFSAPLDDHGCRPAAGAANGRAARLGILQTGGLLSLDKQTGGGWATPLKNMKVNWDD